MPESEELTIETMRVLAKQAGLSLTDEELREVLPGVVRNIERAKALEKWVAQETELPTASLAPRS
jgi:hypothetical protein